MDIPEKIVLSYEISRTSPCIKRKIFIVKDGAFYLGHSYARLFDMTYFFRTRGNPREVIDWQRKGDFVSDGGSGRMVVGDYPAGALPTFRGRTDRVFGTCGSGRSSSVNRWRSSPTTWDTSRLTRVSRSRWWPSQYSMTSPQVTLDLKTPTIDRFTVYLVTFVLYPSSIDPIRGRTQRGYTMGFCLYKQH